MRSIEINNANDYAGLQNAGLVPAVGQVLDAHNEELEPHEYSYHSRAFDVTLQNGPFDRYMSFTFTVVADSFEEASIAAVLRANARLAAYKAAIQAGTLYVAAADEPVALVPFTREHVTEIKQVRSQVTVAR